jgi:hypothetical protein
VPKDEQSVPQDGASTRGPDLAFAVDHPTRRTILRTLIEADRSMTVADLNEVVPNASLSNLRYHVLVLNREDCVSQAGAVVVAHGALPTYAATVSENQFVIRALEATRWEDTS